MPKPRFASLPKRAIGDQRFAAVHFRVLGAVAVHDWMSAARGKGAGCYASNKTLADMCRVNYANFSTAINELGRWGYIEASMHPLSKRTRVYRVIYDCETDPDTLPKRKQSDCADSSPIGKPSNGQPFAHIDPMVCPPSRQATEFIEERNDNIFSETVRDSAKQKNNSSEEASLRDARLRKQSSNNVCGKLSSMEHVLKGGAELDSRTEAWIAGIAEGDYEDSVTQQALRILDTYGMAS